MKKFLILITMCVMSTVLFAQEKDVTKFMGIPVDGTLSNFADALANKGFKQARGGDESIWEGEFNGEECYIYIITTHNRVSRIAVMPKVGENECDIKIKFNKLCNQFKNNPRYMSPKDYTIPEDENIGYKMHVNHKRFEAVFHQISVLDSLTVVQEMQKYVSSKMSETLSEQEVQTLGIEYLTSLVTNNLVWFILVEDGFEYKIYLYYDNVYNRPSGEDL